VGVGSEAIIDKIAKNIEFPILKEIYYTSVYTFLKLF
jgi:hypothetical protein